MLPEPEGSEIQGSVLAVQQILIPVQIIAGNVVLVPGMRICQLVISDVEPEPERDYSQRKDAKYLGEKGTGLSRLYLDSEFEDFLKIHNKNKILEDDKANLIKFLESRLNERSVDITKELSDEEKRKLGLLKYD